MRKNDKRVFDKVKLYHLINFRLAGYTRSTLAIMFDCDVSSIYHQFKKYDIHPLDQVYGLESIIGQILPKPEPPKVINGINQGRNYKDYLKPS